MKKRKHKKICDHWGARVIGVMELVKNSAQKLILVCLDCKSWLTVKIKDITKFKRKK